MLDQAARRELGEPIRAFDARGARRRALARPVLLTAAAAAFAAPAAAAFGSDRLLAGVPAALSAVVCLYAAVWTFRRAAGNLLRSGTPRVLYLFVHGLVVDDGRRLATHHWDELTAVTVSGVQAAEGAPTRWRVTVTAADGREIALGDGTPDAGVLGEIVSAEVTTRAVPRIMAAIEARERVRLGPFTLGPHGIDKDGDRLPWSSVAEAGIDNGMVYARDADGLVEMTALAARVPNAAAFVEVCRRVRDGRRDDGDLVR
ncbi:DUF6585 family protein [Actinomadura sp. NBRC 104425]|uniref:DUF6585 family protein n=1 Tax=Actinomadura sp. NBRC 104425 TaxID=3032204 RepID=UPI002555DB15|nr:DUF6585 family protein [Actinomadura sp. NBRC 104425]